MNRIIQVIILVVFVAIVALSACETEEPQRLEKTHQDSNEGPAATATKNATDAKVGTDPDDDVQWDSDADLSDSAVEKDTSAEVYVNADSDKKDSTGENAEPPGQSECYFPGLAEPVPEEAIRAAQQGISHETALGPCQSGQTARVGEAVCDGGFLDEARAASGAPINDFLSFDRNQYYFVTYCDDERNGTIKVTKTDGSWHVAGATSNALWFSTLETDTRIPREGCTIGKFMIPSFVYSSNPDFFVVIDEEKGAIIYHSDGGTTIELTMEEFPEWIESVI
jgi:hypothetical protein